MTRATAHTLRVLVLALLSAVLTYVGAETLGFAAGVATLIYGFYVLFAVLHAHDPHWAGHKEGK